MKLPWDVESCQQSMSNKQFAGRLDKISVPHILCDLRIKFGTSTEENIHLHSSTRTAHLTNLSNQDPPLLSVVTHNLSRSLSRNQVQATLSLRSHTLPSPFLPAGSCLNLAVIFHVPPPSQIARILASAAHTILAAPSPVLVLPPLLAISSPPVLLMVILHGLYLCPLQVPVVRNEQWKILFSWKSSS